MDPSRNLAVAGVILLATALAGCSSAKNDEYKNARSVPPLEVPPDLIQPPKDTTFAVPAAAASAAGTVTSTPATVETVPASAAQSETPAGSAAAQVTLERDGAQRWLVVTGQVPAVLARAREFLQQDGFDIASEDTATGTIETEWRAADGGRGDARDKEKFSAALAANSQDKFRIRIEAGRVAGTAEIYVGHSGLQRVSPDVEKWQPRAADTLLEAELLSRMRDYFANEASHAEPLSDLPAVNADIVTSADSVATMRIQEDFERAWRRIGIALGRGGFVIEDRNRNDGVYLIRLGRAFKEDAKAGFFGRLFGANAGNPDAQYRVALKGRGNEATVVVQHPGGAPVRTSIGERILNRLKDKME